MSSYKFVAAHAAQHPVALSCRVLGVSRAGYLCLAPAFALDAGSD